MNTFSLHASAVSPEDAVRKALANPSSRFIRGFLFGSVLPPSIPGHYVRVHDDLHLYVDRRADHALRTEFFGSRKKSHWRWLGLSAADPFVFLLGNAVDPDNPSHDLASIAENALEALHRNMSRFHASIARLVGRFVVIWRTTQDNLFLMNDAIGMRPVFYGSGNGTDRFFAAGHALLTHQQTGMRRRPDFESKWGYPGDMTPYEGVYLHNPSTILDLASHKVSRLNPNAPIRSADPDRIGAFIAEKAGTVAAEIARRGPALISLSAGADSRATLALSLPHKKSFRYFTYFRGRSRHVDTAFAASIAKGLGLDHQVIRPRNLDSRDAALCERLDENSFYAHDRGITRTYLQVFGIDSYLHIRSNAVEFFRTSAVDKICEKYGILPVDSSSMARLYLKSGNIQESRESLSRATQAFQRQIDVTSMTQACRKNDPRDVYFIEHRMAAWHSAVALDSDLAFDTTIVFNSRDMLEAARQVPRNVRLADGLIEAIYRAADPQVLDWPINPPEFSG